MKTNQLPDGQLMEIVMTADHDVFEIKPYFNITQEKIVTPVPDLEDVKEVSYTVTIDNVSRFNAEAAFNTISKIPQIDSLVIRNSHFLTDPDDGLPSPFCYLLQLMKTRPDIKSYDISDVFFQDCHLTNLGKGLWNAANNKEFGKKHDWITRIAHKNARNTKDNEILDNFILRNRNESWIHCCFSNPAEPTPNSMDIMYDLCLRVDTFNQTENPNKTFIFAPNIAFTGSQKFIQKPEIPAVEQQELPPPPTHTVGKPTLYSRAYSASYSTVRAIEDTVVGIVQTAKNLINPQKEEGVEMERGSTSSRWEMVRPSYWVKKLEPSSNSRN